MPRLTLVKEGIYFFYTIIILRFNKEKDVIRSTCVYFNFFHQTVNSHNLEIANHIAHVIFVLAGWLDRRRKGWKEGLEGRLEKKEGTERDRREYE